MRIGKNLNINVLNNKNRSTKINITMIRILTAIQNNFKVLGLLIFKSSNIYILHFANL